MGNGEPHYRRPSWMPQDDVLPAIVPVGQFLIRTGRVIIALSHVTVYPNGCGLDVRGGARGSDATREVFENIVFAAQFGTGTSAVTYTGRSPGLKPGGNPALVLMQYGLEGDFTAGRDDNRRADCTLRLWLYPLPSPEPGTLSIVSPSFGPAPASCSLDGRAITAAAAAAQPYWG